MFWKALMYCTGSESPVVVVLSGSMEPGFHRGDILFLNMWNTEDFRAGDIIVFQIKGNSLKNLKKIFKKKNFKIHLSLSDDKPWAVASVIVFIYK